MDHHGALVGWTHQELGDRLMVKIETVTTVAAAKDHDPDVLRVMMTRNQAAILGSYLIGHSGLRPAERPGLIRRLFG
jgi:hypothetical protein